jgi:hypothetical protein
VVKMASVSEGVSAEGVGVDRIGADTLHRLHAFLVAPPYTQPHGALSTAAKNVYVVI